MQNRTLAITRNCTPYFKELRTLVGSVTASILMQQLDYWFSKKEGQPFYKFKAPCENKYYKNGDSFTEELGFSIEEFTNAFAKIGIVYKSKTDFDNTDDKFKGMFYCSYFDRKEGLTFYYRNHSLLDKKLNELFTVNGESQFTQNEKVNLHKTAKSISPIYITENTNNRLQTDIKEKNIKKENSFEKTKNDLTDIFETIKNFDESIILHEPKLEKQLNKVLQDLELSKIDYKTIFQDKTIQVLFLLCIRHKKTRTTKAIEGDLKELQQVSQDKLQDALELWNNKKWQAFKAEWVLKTQKPVFYQNNSTQQNTGPNIYDVLNKMRNKPQKTTELNTITDDNDDNFSF